MNQTANVLKNLIYAGSAEVVTKLLSFGVLLYVARVLGPGALGNLSFALAITSYFLLFTDFGLTTLGIKEIAQDKKLTNQYGSSILYLQTIVSAILVILFAFVLILIPLDASLKWITFLFSLTIFPVAWNMSYVLQAHELMKWVAISRIAAKLSYATLGLGFLFFYKDLIVLPITQIAGGMVAAIIIFFTIRNHVHFILGKIDLAFLKRLARDAWPYVLTSILIQLYFNIDTIMIQFIRGEQEVGFYNAAYQPVILLFSILPMIHGVIFPAFSRLSSEGEKFRHSIILVTKYLGNFAIPVTVGGLLLAPQIISFVYGLQYQPSIGVFQILIIYIAFKYLNVMYEWPLISVNGIKQITIATSVAALSNVALNIVLIPQHGIIGAALATVIAEIMAMAVQSYYFHRIIRLPLVPTYLFKPVIASAIMGLALYFLGSQLHVLLAIALGVAVYLIVALLIKAIDFSELKIMREIREA